MADYIDREELLKKHMHFVKGEEFNLNRPVAVVKTKDILNMPSIDTIEIVRCKDCKYRSKAKPYFCMKFSEIDTEEYHFCTSEDIISFPLWVNDTDYCKWGEKE